MKYDDEALNKLKLNFNENGELQGDISNIKEFVIQRGYSIPETMDDVTYKNNMPGLIDGKVIGAISGAFILGGLSQVVKSESTSIACLGLTSAMVGLTLFSGNQLKQSKYKARHAKEEYLQSISITDAVYLEYKKSIEERIQLLESTEKKGSKFDELQLILDNINKELKNNEEERKLEMEQDDCSPIKTRNRPSFI